MQAESWDKVKSACLHWSKDIFPLVPRASQTGKRGRRNEWQETRKNRNLFQGSKAVIGEIFTPVDTNTASCGRSQDTIHPVLFWLACFPELLNEFPAKANIWPSAITCFGAGKRTAFGALANKLEKLMRKACDGGCRETTIYGLKSVNEEV